MLSQQRGLTIAELPGDVVFFAGAVFEQAQSTGSVPRVVRVSMQGIQPKDQVQSCAVGKVVEFV